MIDNVNSNGSPHVGGGSNTGEIQRIDNQIKRLQEQLKRLKGSSKKSQAEQSQAEKKVKDIQEQIQRLQERKMQAQQKQAQEQRIRQTGGGTAEKPLQTPKGNGASAPEQLLDTWA